MKTLVLGLNQTFRNIPSGVSDKKGKPPSREGNPFLPPNRHEAEYEWKVEADK